MQIQGLFNETRERERRFPMRLLAHCSVCAATVQITWMKLYATPAATISAVSDAAPYAPLDSLVFAICILADMQTFSIPRHKDRLEDYRELLAGTPFFSPASFSSSRSISILPFLSPISLFAFSIGQHNYTAGNDLAIIRWSNSSTFRRAEPIQRAPHVIQWKCRSLINNAKRQKFNRIY